MNKTQEILEENGWDLESLDEEKTIMFVDPDYDTALIGITYDYHLVYDYDKMQEYLVKNGIVKDYEEAADFILYNASYGGSDGLYPLIMFPIDQPEQ